MKVVNEWPLIEICTSGATIDDPWECMKEYNDKLKNEDGCDMVLPLCHLYEHQDERTCNEFDFPVILSGHDHHRVDRVVNGTRQVHIFVKHVYPGILLESFWKPPEILLKTDPKQMLLFNHYQ